MGLPPALSLTFVDTDGDTICYRWSGRLEVWVNGKLECGDVRRIIYVSATGQVHDGDGEFRLPEERRSEIVHALYVLAKQSGVRWTGCVPEVPRGACADSESVSVASLPPSPLSDMDVDEQWSSILSSAPRAPKARAFDEESLGKHSLASISTMDMVSDSEVPSMESSDGGWSCLRSDDGTAVGEATPAPSKAARSSAGSWRSRKTVGSPRSADRGQRAALRSRVRSSYLLKESQRRSAARRELAEARFANALERFHQALASVEAERAA